MNLEYLNTFAEVVRSGSFSEVARKLSITQPAVSFQIQKLERDLGVRLLERRQKKILVTEAGKRLLAFAHIVGKENEKLTRELDALRDTVSGELLIAASTIPGEFLLPAMLGAFKVQHPAVSIKVEVSDSLTVIAGVGDGTYEVGFCGIVPHGVDLEKYPVGDDEIVLIVFPEHPFCQREKVSLVEVIDEPLIMREENSGTQHHIMSLLSEAGINHGKMKSRLVLGTSQAVVSAVEAEAGIAFVSSLAIQRSLALNLVRQVKVEGVALKRQFYCVYRKERMASRLQDEFIDFVNAGTADNL